MADSPRSLVRVVVPVYRELTPDEESSLRNNVRVLAAWPFTVLHPRGVTPPACCRELGLETRAVGDEWLGRRNGIAGYNRMIFCFCQKRETGFFTACAISGLSRRDF